MLTINGTHNTAVCYTDELEPTAEAQIQTLCDQEAFADNKIRIMPDVHAGMGCTIGTTMTITDKIVPGMVGVDIGCGMETVKLEDRTVDFYKLDDCIRREIPSGRDVRITPHSFSKKTAIKQLRCVTSVDIERANRSIGTLGGGNHFIEINRAEDGGLYLVVHSGSRHIGTEVADIYQKKAVRQVPSGIPRDLTYVSGQDFNDYLHDMKIIQHFADINRQAMVDVLLKKMNLTETGRFTTVHNYIDMDSFILRKGAVSAKKDERLLIPINMRDGSLICVGKGNAAWNFSAPHGAGRLMSRKTALKQLSMDEYASAMKNIFTTSVNRKTLDESPMAYKNMNDIVKHIAHTADIVERIIPVYNYKASE